MKRDYKLFVQDILQAIKDIETFVRDMDHAKFSVDEKTKNIPKSTTAKYDDLPWKYMARIRDKIAHFYFGIDYEIVWDVVKNKLPGIRPGIERILSEFENTEGTSGVYPRSIEESKDKEK